MKPMVATTLDLREELIPFHQKIARESLERRGYKVFDMPADGLIAFPGGNK